jgi:hypothetical protein
MKSSLEDISAMKLNAILGNGTRLKDFIDIAYLSCYLSLNRMIEAYEIKYSTRNPLAILKSLTYFNDINFNEPIQFIGGNYSWKAIANRINQMVKYPEMVFAEKP